MSKPTTYNLSNVYDHPFAQDAEVQEAFADYLAMRKKIKKPTTERGLKLLLLTLVNLSGDNKERAIKIIDRSNTQNWLDFYQLRDEDSVGFETPQQRAERLAREDRR